MKTGKGNDNDKYRDLSTTAASAPPSVEMTGVFWVGWRRKGKGYGYGKSDGYDYGYGKYRDLCAAAASALLSVEMTCFLGC